MRFLADENFDARIVEGVRFKQPEVVIRTAAEAGILGMPDPDVLAYAAGEGAILLSHDVSTMPGHFAALLATGSDSPGVILIAQSLAIGQAVEAVLLVWGASEADEWRNRVAYLSL